MLCKVTAESWQSLFVFANYTSPEELEETM
jgi:hypothetical protein